MRTLAVLSGGHPFDEAGFAALLASLAGWEVSHLRHPEAERAVADGAIDNADALLFYDMPGYDFSGGEATERPPDPAFCDRLRARFAAGRGAVAMHHALAGWAAWPEWSDWLGGRFLYRPGTVRGQEVPDSGYRHDVAYRAAIVGDHPVTAGLPASFDVRDELYLAQIFLTDVQPLLRAGHDFTDSSFYSAREAVAGRLHSRAGWRHPPGSDLVGWVSRAVNAPLVYLQFGDGLAAYGNPHLRRLLTNALDFVATGDTP